MYTRLVSFISLLVFTSGLFGGVATPQKDEITFPKTGQKTYGEFKDYYLQAVNPQKTLGDAITPPFIDPIENILVQYFIKGRLEFHPEASPEERVVRTDIGARLREKYGEGEKLPLPNDDTHCRLFESTGYKVCYEFLDFFEANGGEACFGPPISNFEKQDGKIVQYFANARLEWRPDLPPGEQVVVSNLGLEYFRLYGGDQTKLIPEKGVFAIDGENLQLRIKASVARSVITRGGNQEVFIFVYNQMLLPVENAQVTISVSLPDEVVNYIIPTMTDSTGKVSFSFPVGNHVGAAIISINATHNGVSGETSTTFRIWW